MNSLTATILEAQQGSDEAKENLFRHYELFLHKIVIKFCYNLSPEDLFQEASIAFFKAVETYNPEMKVHFTFYVKKIITNHLINYCKKNSKIKKVEYSNDSMEKHIVEEKVGEYELSSKFLQGVETKLKHIFNHEFTPLERNIFYYYINNYSYKDIANLLKRDQKSVDNALFRAKVKLSSSLNREEIDFITGNNEMINKVKNMIIL